MACIAVSMAVALIIYGIRLISLNPWHILAWLFGPLGVYTIIYALIKSRDLTYHLVWGAVTISIAIASITYNVLNPIVILGSLILVIVIIGLLGYWRGRKG